jgi:hypothetical protein
MLYRMPLAIFGAINTRITVVKSPVAHKRGGASPALLRLYDSAF